MNRNKFKISLLSGIMGLVLFLIPLISSAYAGASCDVTGDCGGGAETCVNHVCVTPSTGNGNSGNSGSGVICDTANGYTMQNGLCIPNSPFSGGFANQSTLSGLITTILNFVLMLAGIIAVVFIIIGGYRYMTAGGNEENAEKGRKALVNAIIGLLIVILAFTIVQVVSNALTSSSPIGK